jgi:hypothetical protein
MRHRMPDHSPDCPCYPCKLRRQVENYEALDDECLPPLDDLDGLPEDFGGTEELEGDEA